VEQSLWVRVPLRALQWLSKNSKERAGEANEGTSVYPRLRVCLTAGMDFVPESSSEGGLEIFVAQQAIYRRVIEADYMSHRALFGIFHDLLEARSELFSLLDLACGDAACSVGALRRTKVSDYVAVDLSEPALSLAVSNTNSLPCATRVVRRDFQEYVNAASRLWDVIFIGFSFHHLNSKAKAAFAPRIRRVLAAGGEWIFFEPMLHGNETREEFLDRWKASLELDWRAFTPEEKATIWEHVSQYDFPENSKSFERIALEGGFRSLEHLYTDPFCFYGAFRAVV
jgi:ubiquinone/menaquinone biosynthesis C-methylase UbiE